MPMQPILRGEFVALRPLAVEDAERTFRWRQGERALNLNPGAPTVEAQRAWIAARPASEYNFIIELLDGRPVGMLSLVGVDTAHRHAEPGRFLIGEEEATRGVPAAVEAMKLLYAFAFDTLGLVRLHGTIASDNTAIHKWQLYLGMKEEGRLRNHYFINGHFQDAICMGLLEEEYRKVSLPRMRVLIAAGRGATPPPTKGASA
ncbi:MAG TPA: GNAT family protein [Holophagaceae bacterium]|nr:GNAT family protein [Holophagaceae bacterium]